MKEISLRSEGLVAFDAWNRGVLDASQKKIAVSTVSGAL
jgi:hypothetical protein